MKLLVAAVMLLATPVADAAPAYSCKSADGSMTFSETPCGKNAKELQLPAGGHSGSTEHPRAAPVAVDAVRDISDGRDDARCRDAARNLYVEPNSSALIRAQAELKGLEGRRWTGGTASGRQLLAENDQTHIASVRSLISTEQSRADATRAESQARVDDALVKCDARKHEVEQSRKRGELPVD